MPQISVIVPVYNVEAYLRRCVDSILGQSFTDFELILVDDGSPDGCPAICDEYAKKDSRVVVIHQENGGLSSARNKGIDWALTKSDSLWLSFIDSDDWVHLDYLQNLYDGATQNEVSICACLFTAVQSENDIMENVGNGTTEVMSAENFYSLERKGVPTISACVKLFRKDLFREIRFPVGMINEDLYTTYKLIFSCDRVAVCDSPIYYYFMRPGSIMRSEWTPRRLLEFAGYDEVLRFLKERDYIKAWESTVRKYCFRLAEQCQELTNQNDGRYIEYLSDMRKKLRTMMHGYAKVLNLDFQKDIKIYEAAFPQMMRMYWLVCAGWKLLKEEGPFTLIKKVLSRKKKDS